MSSDGGGPAADLDGLDLDAAVERVVDADPDRDPERVRAVLGECTEDGVVSADAAADAVAHAATVVSTPETRVELTASALSDARAAADPVADLDVVAARLAVFEERLDALEDRLDDLTDALDDVVEAESAGDLYGVATGVERLTADANATASTADELAAEVEAFETWVTDPDTRYDRLADDADAVAETLDTLEAIAIRVEDVAGPDGDDAETAADHGDDDVADGAETAADDDDDDAADSADARQVTLPGGETAEPGVAWFDVAVRQAMVAVLVADLRVEYETFETWADRERVAPPPAALADRIDDLDERCGALGDRVDALTRPTWFVRFEDRLDTVTSRFDALEPPVDWRDVHDVLEQL